MIVREKLFNKAMKDIGMRAKDECGYDVTVFFKMLSEKGGVSVAKSLVVLPGFSYMFANLAAWGRLDLSIEALVVNDDYKELFNDHERYVCRKRLEESGYEIVNNDRSYSVLPEGLQETGT